MTPEQYRKALEALVVAHPVYMAQLVQTGGPIPDGESDKERALIIKLIEASLGQR